ncbi:MAG: hypothetical protein ACTSQY_03225 [Candidatus Odinarchaeia archaeon]
MSSKVINKEELGKELETLSQYFELRGLSNGDAYTVLIHFQNILNNRMLENKNA